MCTACAVRPTASNDFSPLAAALPGNMRIVVFMMICVTPGALSEGNAFDNDLAAYDGASGDLHETDTATRAQSDAPCDAARSSPVDHRQVVVGCPLARGVGPRARHVPALRKPARGCQGPANRPPRVPTNAAATG